MGQIDNNRRIWAVFVEFSYDHTLSIWLDMIILSRDAPMFMPAGRQISGRAGSEPARLLQLYLAHALFGFVWLCFPAVRLAVYRHNP